MSDTAISVTTLTKLTMSGDLITTAEGGTSVAAGDTAVIDVGGDVHDVFFTFYTATASTVTVQAGDNPPALKAGLGASSALSVPSGDVLVACIDGARHVHDDGKVRMDVATTATVIGAYRLPKTI